LDSQNQRFEENRTTDEAEFGLAPVGTYPISLSPWLEITRWHRYLHGQKLLKAAELINLPQPQHQPLQIIENAAMPIQYNEDEAILTIILDVFDQLIEEARKSVLADEANVSSY
jgi:hypothetical protein